MQQVILNVDDEVKALGDAMKVLIVDIKNKKSIAQDVSDVLPNLLAAAGGFTSFAGDVKKVDNQAYLAKSLAEALEPAPTPAA